MSSLIIPIGPASRYKGTYSDDIRYNKANVVTLCACQFICKVNGQMARPPLVIDDEELGTMKFANEDIWKCSIDQLEWWNRQHVILSTIEELVRQHRTLTEALNESEGVRVENENTRSRNEIVRKEEELKRVRAELERKSQERLREQAESERAEEFDTLFRKVNNAIEICSTVSSNPTYVGEDYFVYVYDLENDVYVKTNIYLKGEDLDWSKMTDQEKDDLCERIELDRILDDDIEEIIGKVDAMDEEDECCAPLRWSDIYEATDDNDDLDFDDPLIDSEDTIIITKDDMMLLPRKGVE